MKLLDYIYHIADSEEEFLAIVKEMNSWCEDEKNKGRFIHMPYNIERFNFSRDEYRQAFELAEKAIQSSQAH